MHAAIHVPRFALQAALRVKPQVKRAAVAVLEVTESPDEQTKKDQQRLLHVNEAAERHGIHAGMATGMAVARCRDLVLLHRDAEAEQAAQASLLECAAQWTPYYETTAPGLCVLDVSCVHHLTNRLEACGRSIHEHLASERLHASIGFAPNADLATLAAQAAKPVLVWRESEGDTARHLHALPLSALSPAPETAVLLRLWGIHTLGDLQRLPRQEVAMRLGREGSRLWDMAAGGRERLMRLFRPALRYHEEMELEHAVESLEPLLFLLRRILETLCHRLTESWLVAAAMKLSLGFDDRQEREATLRIAEPTRDIDLLLRLLHTHMEGVTASAPVVKVALELVPTRPAGSQMQIFERGLRDPNRFAETLAQVEALVGNGNVGRVKLRPTRALDGFEVRPFLGEEETGGNDRLKPALQRGTANAKVGVQALACQSPIGLPLRRIRPARSVDVMLVNGRPSVMHAAAKSHLIRACSGPWLVSGDWWGDARWQREVWEVETSDGVLYQLTRHNGQWQLEGVFG